MIISRSFTGPEPAVTASRLVTRATAALLAVFVAVAWYGGLLYLLLRGARLVLGLIF